MPRKLAETDEALDRQVMGAIEFMLALDRKLRIRHRYNEARTALHFAAEMKEALAFQKEVRAARLLWPPPREWNKLRV